MTTLGRQAVSRQVQGFTLVEILVAIAILGILAAVLTATITGSLGLNRRAQQDLDSTTRAQQVIETVRNAWTVQANYATACAPGVTLTGMTVTFVNLDSRAVPRTAGTDKDAVQSSGCTAKNDSVTGVAPAMRRLSVSTGSAVQDTTLTLDILRPQP